AQYGHAVSGADAAGAARADSRCLGHHRDEPAGTLLRADARRPAAAGEGKAVVGGHGRHHPGPLVRESVMRVLREWLLRLWGTLRPTRADADLDEELRLHLELVAEVARRRGHDPDEAVRLAQLEAGGRAQAMEAMRD